MSYIGNNPTLKSIISTGDSFANLNGEARRQGRFVYATDTNLFYHDDGATLTPIVHSVAGKSGDLTLDGDDISDSATRFMAFKSNHTTSSPTVTDDSASNYAIGSQWYNSDSNQLYIAESVGVGAAVWQVVSGTGGGGLDIFHSQGFESDIASGDFTSERSATYKNADLTPFGGTLSDETSLQIAGTLSPKYTAGAASENDWFDIETVALDLKQRGEVVGVTFYADMTNFSVDAEFVVWDITNGAKLTASTDVLAGGLGRKRYSFSFFIPTTCTSLSYGFHMVNAPVNAESFLSDDFQFSSDPFTIRNLSHLEDFAEETLIVGSTGTNPTKGSIVRDSVLTTRVGSFANVEVDYVQLTGVRATGTYLFTLPNGMSFDTSRLSTSTTITVNSNDAATRIGGGTITQNAAAWGTVTAHAYDATRYYLIWDTLVTDATVGTPAVGGDIGNPFAANATIDFEDNVAIRLTLRLPVLGWVAKSEHVITPAQSNITEAVTYTPVYSHPIVGSEVIYWNRQGKDMIMRGVINFNGVGGDGAAFTFALPSGLTTDTSAMPNSGRVILGSGMFLDDSLTANNKRLVTSVNWQGGDQIGFIVEDMSTLAANEIANPDTMSFELTIPITEWDNNVVFLAAIPKPAYAYYSSTGAQTISGPTVIKFDSKRKDDKGMYNAATGLLTIPETGTYLIGAKVLWDGASYVAGENFDIHVYENGATTHYLERTDVVTNNSNPQNQNGTVVLDLEEGDTIEIRGAEGVTVAVSLGTSAVHNYFYIVQQGF